MTSPAVSVVIVTRHRPKELLKCLKALQLQTYDKFEIVVVGDQSITSVLEETNLSGRVKQTLFDEENISRARNIGIGLSAGDLVAFIDDDAVAEPTWLEHLVAPFADASVGASGGYTRGRNGISYQWRAERVDRSGWSHPFDLPGTEVFTPNPDAAIKTHGTNCAFRRDILIRLGGFDENFRFFLEDADMNLRIAEAGHATAIVPDAEVQHGYAPSARRSASRAPLSLYEISASQAYFQTKHAIDGAKLEPVLAAHRRSIHRHIVSGLLEPRDVRRLSAEVVVGFADGAQRRPVESKGLGKPERFSPLPTHRTSDHLVFYATWWTRRQAFSIAVQRAARGESLTLMVFSPTTLFHRRWFHECGFWVQTGGIYGKSLRGDPVYRRYTAFERAEHERELVFATRKAVFPPLPIATQSP